MNMFRHPFQILEERGVCDVHAMEVPERIGHEIVWNQEASQARQVCKTVRALRRCAPVEDHGGEPTQPWWRAPSLHPAHLDQQFDEWLSPHASGLREHRPTLLAHAARQLPARQGHDRGPKTGRAREVRLLTGTVAALKAHRDRQAVERLVADDAYAPHGFVFADERGEPLQGTVVYKYHWQLMLKRLGLPPVRLHDCRHTAATIQLGAGIDIKWCRKSGARQHHHHGRRLLAGDAPSPAGSGRQVRGAPGRHKDKSRTTRGIGVVSHCTGPSSNGRTADFGSVNGGSNPPGPILLSDFCPRMLDRPGKPPTVAARPLHSRLGLDPLAQEFLGLGYSSVPLG